MKLKPDNLNPDFRRFCDEPPEERQALFTQVALTRNANAVAIEKDFYVCRVIDAIFHGLPFKPKPFFKGGTSLSKGYDLISRFSEDIDLIVSPRGLGFREDQDPANPKIGKKALKRVLSKSDPEALPTKLKAYTEEKMKTSLQELLPDCTVAVAQTDDPYGAALAVEYNSVLPADTGIDDVIKRSVLVETGGRSAREPADQRDIVPYIQDEVDSTDWQFEVGKVTIITPRRTFWDKVLIVDGLNRQPPGRPERADRKSRHLYDLARIFGTGIGNDAIADVALFAAVHSAFNAASDAKPGSFVLVPSGDLLARYRRDYDEGTARMIFGSIPTFDWVIGQIESLQATLNQPVSDAVPTSLPTPA